MQTSTANALVQQKFTPTLLRSAISPARWRGRLVGPFQFCVVSGILLAYFSNYVVGLQHFGDTEWRVKFGVAALPALIFLALLFTIPRSPRWLAKQGRTEEARVVLEATGEPDPQGQLREIIRSIDEEHHRKDEPLFYPETKGVSLEEMQRKMGIS
jgi:MFS family permease